MISSRVWLGSGGSGCLTRARCTASDMANAKGGAIPELPAYITAMCRAAGATPRSA